MIDEVNEHTFEFLRNHVSKFSHIKIIEKNYLLILHYQVGSVLSISHGMGVPSIGILLHEVIKLMYHAKCKDPVFIRLGTCGGVGIEGGTVVVSDDAVDGLLRNTYEMVRIGSFF